MRIAVFALALGLAPESVPRTQSAVSPIAAPVADAPDVEWAELALPDLGKLRLAIARPRGVGPFPAVIVLHGTHGFAREYVKIASALARKNILAVAACWFSGGGGEGAGFVTPIDCPGAPAMTAAASDTTFATIDALVRAVRALPDVRMDAITLFGHSRGGGAALNYVLKGGEVAGAVVESAGYADEQLAMIPRVATSILILHGAGDTSADGGSPFQTTERARDFEAALRAAGKQVRAVYYGGAGHNGLFSDPMQFDAEIAETAAFAPRLGR